MKYGITYFFVFLMLMLMHALSPLMLTGFCLGLFAVNYDIIFPLARLKPLFGLVYILGLATITGNIIATYHSSFPFHVIHSVILGLFVSVTLYAFFFREEK